MGAAEIFLNGWKVMDKLQEYLSNCMHEKKSDILKAPFLILTSKYALSSLF